MATAPRASLAAFTPFTPFDFNYDDAINSYLKYLSLTRKIARCRRRRKGKKVKRNGKKVQPDNNGLGTEKHKIEKYRLELV